VYLKHFGLTRFPFDKELAADDLFVSAGMRELATRLGHLIEMNGIGLVTGDPGSGKSCAARAMAARLHTGLYKVFYVPHATGNPMDLYKSIAWEMGLGVERSRAALYRQIRNEVTRLSTETHAPGADPGRGPRAAKRRARGDAAAHELRDGLAEPALPALLRAD
jgi:general secretion pathway protein A